MKKFNPLYRVTVYTQTETITIKLPITCKMTITRSVLAESISANIQLYNLAPSTRNMIFQDLFVIDQTQWKYVHVEAGYGDEESLSMIFQGRILQAYSRKAGGQTDVITEIQAQALDIFDCQSSHTFAAGTTYQEAYNILGSDLLNCVIGNTGNLQGIFQTSTTFDGNTFEQLNKLSGGNTFVDNGTLNTIMSNECIDVPVPVISDSAGLLETPVRRDASLDVKMIFQPDLIIGQLLEIKSNIFTAYNGQYKVLGFTHDLLFSASQAGTRTTTCQLWIGPLLPGAQITQTGDKVQNKFDKVKGTDISSVNSTIPESIQAVYRYIQDNNGAPPEKGKISRSVLWKEMIGNNNKDSERLSQLNIYILTNCYQTAIKFQEIVDKYYPGSKVQINSGWRSTQNNASCQGKPNSKHLRGLAIDFRIQGKDQYNDVYRTFQRAWNGKVIYYPKGNFVHIQTDSTLGAVNDR